MLFLAGVYRTPQYKNKEFLARLDSLINLLLQKENYLIVAGDLNVNMLEDTTGSKELKTILLGHGLEFLVNFPTRVTLSTESCIDNVLTNIKRNDLRFMVLQHCCLTMMVGC